MTRLIAIVACAAPLALAATQDASLRGAKVAMGNGESVHVQRHLTADDDGRGMGPTPTTTYDGWDDPSTAGQGIVADTEEEGTYTHIGCFSDSKEDRVLGHMLWADDMTAKECHVHCNVRGAFYMATQYGRECWCSREQDLDYASVDAGVCDMPCTGDADESCGGYDAFDLYELVWPAEPTDPEYMDCFSDRKEDRVMSKMHVAPDMTQAACRSHCDGYMYYATQYGNECWCGSSEVFGDYDRHGEGTCHMPCSGDSSVACGGYNAFSLYRFIDVQPGGAPEPSTPTPSPEKAPTPSPEKAPTPSPEKAPTPSPEKAPTPSPEKAPTPSPEKAPTPSPEKAPTPSPEKAPTPSPEKEPTPSPEPEPTPSPVAQPTPSPEKAPTPSPEPAPTPAPVEAPTPAPVESDDGGGGGGAEGSFDDTVYKGDGTYYGATTGGNCAFGTNVPSMYNGMIPVALNEPQYGDSLMCGACIEGEGSGVGSGGNPISGKFKAYVSDKCPECKNGDLDFSESGDGRWEISWKFVPCSGGSEEPSFMFEGSHEYYWKLQPRGTNSPVVELSVNGAKGERTDDNFFIVTEGVPFYGEQLVVTKTVGGTTHEMEVAI